MKKIDISTYTRNSDFYGKLDLLLTVKSFDLQAIRKRYLASKKNMRSGSVERREVALGGIVELSIEKGKLEREAILAKVKEPRGIHFHNQKLSVSSENQVYILDRELKSITNPWFSYIHTVEFSPFDDSKLLVSSSGFDAMFEYDWRNSELLWEWFAWENGMNKGVNPETLEPIYLTRKSDVAKKYIEEGKEVLLIENPEGQTLPTAKRAAFINSVSYSQKSEGVLSATLFHKGAMALIHQKDSKVDFVIEDMKNPHGGIQLEDRLMATSTGTGEVVLKGDEEVRYQFINLEGKPEILGDMEWLQNAKMHNGFVITIDSNRTSFVIFDPVNKWIDIIPYDNNWAVQDMVVGVLDDEQREMLRKI